MQHSRVSPSLVSIAFGGLAIIILASSLPFVLGMGANFNGYGRADYQLYVDATNRWLGGEAFYEPYQLAGPYQVSFGAILYPPVALFLFVPFTFLPAVLWWVVPIGLTAWAIAYLRPRFVVWPLMAICVASPPTVIRLITGNPVIWAMAFVALGVVTNGPAAFALIKPSLAPFAFWGARHRRWWIWLSFVGLLSLPFGAMWLDWLTAIRNADTDLAYSVEEAPMLALPIIAWLGRGAKLRSNMMVSANTQHSKDGLMA